MMAPVAEAVADDRGGRSGGKMLKSRVSAGRKTPYDRPIQPQPTLQQPENPSWISGLVLPAKFVAGGASKIISSFWNPRSWGDPSSSSETDSEDESGDDENPSDELIELNQKDRSSGKSETLHLVEQLLMLEHYSREDCDRLTEIINSRVVDYSTREGVDAGTNTPDIRSQAIIEAKKWVAEQKVGSGLKSYFDNGIDPFKSVMTPQSTEGEVGSPVDVARSYMRARPPWASPINHNNSLSPSPLASDLFKERTPYSSIAGSSFPSAKRDYLSGGSWNLQDEIRRLRSKATEDLLSSHRSIKTLQDTPIRSLHSFRSPKSIPDGFTLARSDKGTSEKDLSTEVLPSQPTMPVQDQYQVMGRAEMIDGQDGASNKSHIPEGEERADNQMVNDMDKSCYLMTESTEIPLVSNSQGSSSTKEDDDNDQSFVKKVEKRAVIRATRRGKGRVK